VSRPAGLAGGIGRRSSKAAQVAPLFVNAMGCARAFETDPAIMGASAHLLAVAPAGR